MNDVDANGNVVDTVLPFPKSKKLMRKRWNTEFKSKLTLEEFREIKERIMKFGLTINEDLRRRGILK
jgi:chemotaxis regulatin CheY-phosphate phosphatase CheZ